MIQRDLQRPCGRSRSPDGARRLLGDLILAVATREEPFLLPLGERLEELQARMTPRELRLFRSLLRHLIDDIDHG